MVSVVLYVVVFGVISAQRYTRKQAKEFCSDDSREHEPIFCNITSTNTLGDLGYGSFDLPWTSDELENFDV